MQIKDTWRGRERTSVYKAHYRLFFVSTALQCITEPDASSSSSGAHHLKSKSGQLEGENVEIRIRSSAMDREQQPLCGEV